MRAENADPSSSDRPHRPPPVPHSVSRGQRNVRTPQGEDWGEKGATQTFDRANAGISSNPCGQWLQRCSINRLLRPMISARRYTRASKGGWGEMGEHLRARPTASLLTRPLFLSSLPPPRPLIAETRLDHEVLTFFNRQAGRAQQRAKRYPFKLVASRPRPLYLSPPFPPAHFS